jgi:hypothetical protein
MKKRKYKLITWLETHWRGLLTGLVITALAIFTLSLQIGTLVEGQNKFETATLNQISTLDNIENNLVNAPYLLPAYGLGQLIDNPLIGARIVSVVYGLLATGLLFLLLKRWLNFRAAAIGSLVFITSAWVLSISHQAAPFIMLVFTPLLITVALTKFVNSKEKLFANLLILGLSLALAAYIPYMIWTIIAVTIVLLAIYYRKLALIKPEGLLVIFFSMLLVAGPLIYSLYLNPEQFKLLAGIPNELPQLSIYASNFFGQFVAIFASSKALPELFISQKPLIDIFSAAMLVLGIYHFYKFMPKRRKVTIALTLTLLLLIIPLQEEYLIALTAILPFVYIFIAAGIHELTRQWFYVFPRNPFARIGGAIILVVVIGLSVTYNLQKFYIAWPNTPETRAAYMIESKQ